MHRPRQRGAPEEERAQRQPVGAVGADAPDVVSDVRIHGDERARPQEELVRLQRRALERMELVMQPA